MCEGLETQKAILEYEKLERCMNLNDPGQATEGSREAGLKQLLAHAILEITKIDRDSGIYMLEMYGKWWTSVVGRVLEIKTYEDYYAHRRLDLRIVFVLQPPKM